MLEPELPSVELRDRLQQQELVRYGECKRLEQKTYWELIVKLVHGSTACWAAFSGNDPYGLTLGQACGAFPARDLSGVSDINLGGGLSESAHRKHDKRHLWAALFGLDVGVLLTRHQGGELLNAQALENLMAADVGELVERHGAGGGEVGCWWSDG